MVLVLEQVFAQFPQKVSEIDGEGSEVTIRGKSQITEL